MIWGLSAGLSNFMCIYITSQGFISSQVDRPFVLRASDCGHGLSYGIHFRNVPVFPVTSGPAEWQCLFLNSLQPTASLLLPDRQLCYLQVSSQDSRSAWRHFPGVLGAFPLRSRSVFRDGTNTYIHESVAAQLYLQIVESFVLLGPHNI